MRNIKDKVTLNQLIDIFRGSAAKKSSKYSSLNSYGAGRDMSKVEVERLLQNLCVQNILQQYCHSNPMGYVSSYVRLGKEARKLDSGELKFMLTMETAETDAPTGVKQTNRRKRKSEENGKPKAEDKRKKKLESLSSEEEYEEIGSSESEYEASPEFEDVFSSSSTKNTTTSVRENIEKKKESPEKESLQTELFKTLKQKRQHLCIQNKLQTNQIPDAVLLEIVKKLPASLIELGNIKGMGEKHTMVYGPSFIEVVLKYRDKLLMYK